MRHYDVVIVGGGPVGGLVAKHVSSKGFSTLILEEHATVGRPVRCAGLVTQRVLDIGGVSKDVVLNRISGSCVHSPSGCRIEIGGKKTHAFSINRERFDKEIVQQAMDKGADLRLNCKAIDINKHRVVLTRGKEIGYKFLVGSDGPRSFIRKTFGFPQPREMIFGINAEVPINHDPSLVDIFFGEKIAPGFFSWVIPAGDTTRVGLGVIQGYNPRTYLDLFLKKLKINSPVSMHMGFIPLGPIRHLVQDNVAIVGDAACQVKPSSGGGLFPGLSAARYCSNSLIKALEGGISLKTYPKEWFLKIGKELKIGYILRKFFLHMDDQKLERLFNILGKEDMISVINNYGDIDYPSRVIIQLFKQHPSLLKFLPFFLF